MSDAEVRAEEVFARLGKEGEAPGEVHRVEAARLGLRRRGWIVELSMDGGVWVELPPGQPLEQLAREVLRLRDALTGARGD